MSEEVFNTNGFSLSWLIPTSSLAPKFDVEKELHVAIVGENPEESQS